MIAIYFNVRLSVPPAPNSRSVINVQPLIETGCFIYSIEEEEEEEEECGARSVHRFISPFSVFICCCTNTDRGSPSSSVFMTKRSSQVEVPRSIVCLIQLPLDLCEVPSRVCKEREVQPFVWLPLDDVQVKFP